MTDQAAANVTTPKENKAEQDFKQYEKLLPPLAFTAIGILFLVYLFNFTVFTGNTVFGDNNAFGTFGDFMGGALNPILGFFTVLLLIKSIRFQIDELKSTKEELAKTSSANEKIANFQKRNLVLQHGVFLAPLLEKRLALKIDELEKLAEEHFSINPPLVASQVHPIPRSLGELLVPNPDYAALICAMPDSEALREFIENLNIAAKELLEKIRECYKIIMMMQRYRLPGIIYDINLDHLESTISQLTTLLCEKIVSSETSHTLVQVRGTLNFVLNFGIQLDIELRDEAQITIR